MDANHGNNAKKRKLEEDGNAAAPQEDRKRSKAAHEDEVAVAEDAEEEEEEVKTVEQFATIPGAWAIVRPDGSVGLSLKEHIALDRILRGGHMNDLKRGMLEWNGKKYLVVQDEHGMPFLFAGDKVNVIYALPKHKKTSHLSCAQPLEIIKFTDTPPCLMMVGSEVAQQHNGVLLSLVVDTLIENLYDLGNASILDFVRGAMKARKPNGSFAQIDDPSGVEILDTILRAYSGQMGGSNKKIHVEKAECFFHYTLAKRHVQEALGNVRSDEQQLSFSLLFHSASGAASIIKARGMAVANNSNAYDTFRFFPTNQMTKKKKNRLRDQFFVQDPLFLAQYPELQRRGSLEDGLFYIYVVSALDSGDSVGLPDTQPLPAGMSRDHASTLRFFEVYPEHDNTVLPLFRLVVRVV